MKTLLRGMARVYYDTLRDTKCYVEHGTLPHELIILAWDHLAIGGTKAGTPPRPVPAIGNPATATPAAGPELVMTRGVQPSNTSQALILDSPLSVSQNVLVVIFYYKYSCAQYAIDNSGSS